MKILSIIFMFTALLASQVLYAHSNHSHGTVTETKAQTIAADVASDLSSRDAELGFGQLPKSWAAIPVKNVVIFKKGKGYYIVSVLNDSEKKHSLF